MTALWPTGSTTQPRLSDRYGPRVGIVGARPFHYGVDIPMALGAPIAAAQDGKVIFSGRNGSLGVQVVIQSAAGQFLYPHEEDGAQLPLHADVRQGAPVGKVGLTGLTNGPHVCFRTFEGSWRNDSDARDPVRFMAALNAGPAAIALTDIKELDMSALILQSTIGETLVIDGIPAVGDNTPAEMAAVTGVQRVGISAAQHRAYLVRVSRRDGLPLICYVDGSEGVYLLDGGAMKPMHDVKTLVQIQALGAPSVTITASELDAWIK